MDLLFIPTTLPPTCKKSSGRRLQKAPAARVVRWKGGLHQCHGLHCHQRGRTDQVCGQLAFYASTPSYRPVMDLHGWGPVADELRALAPRGAWAEMAERIDHEMLRTFAVVGTEF